jgi:hypothetical protein
MTEKPSTLPETLGRRQRYILEFQEAEFLSNFIDAMDSRQEQYVVKVDWTRKTAEALFEIEEWDLNAAGEYVPYVHDPENVRRLAKSYGATITRGPVESSGGPP